MSGRPEDQKADTLESAFWFLDGMPLPNDKLSTVPVFAIPEFQVAVTNAGEVSGLA